MLCCHGMHANHRLTNLLYPLACLLCGARLPARPADPDSEPLLEVVCAVCRQAMPISAGPVCTRCGVELPGAFDAVVECASCRQTPLAFTMARAPWQYAGQTQIAVRQFKYRRRWRLGWWFARQMTLTARHSFPLEEITSVLPVPLHWVKRRLKGFSPAEHLASAVARSLDKPYAPHALRRTRWTATQTQLSERERFRNVQRAFAASAALINGRSVLLIDDVLTSGATAHACALTLKAAGAHAVFVLTAARTPRA